MLPLWSTTTWWKTRKAIALRLGFESQCVVKLAIVCRTLWPARQRDLAYRWLLYIAYIYMRLSRKILQRRHLPLLRWLCLYTPRSGIQSTKGWVVSVFAISHERNQKKIAAGGFGICGLHRIWVNFRHFRLFQQGRIHLGWIEPGNPLNMPKLSPFLSSQKIIFR